MIDKIILEDILKIGVDVGINCNDESTLKISIDNIIKDYELENKIQLIAKEENPPNVTDSVLQTYIKKNYITLHQVAQPNTVHPIDSSVYKMLITDILTHFDTDDESRTLDNYTGTMY